MSNIVSSQVKNYFQRNGFVMVSNLLIDHQQELGITESEFSFIIKVMRFKGSIIHDRELDPTVCSKTLSRKRASLKQKGLLNFSVVKTQDPDNGQFKTDGINYDFSPLEDKLQAISDKLEEKKQKKLEEKIVQQNKIVEKVEDDSPVETYKKDYKEHYGVDYVLNPYEIRKYNSLPEEDKFLVSYIFDYCEEKNLFDDIVPRLSLFFKAKFRFDDLRKYCEKNGYTNEKVEIGHEAVFPDLDGFVEQVFKEYYPTGSNYVFYRRIDTIIYRNLGEDKIITPYLRGLLDHAYKDTLQFRKI